MIKLIVRAKKNFRLKLILCFLLCAIIPILAIGITSYVTSFQIAESKLIESTQLTDKQVAKSIDERINQIENLADSVHFYLYNDLYRHDGQKLSSYMNQISSLRSNINSIADSFDIYHISVFMESNSIVSREGLLFYPMEAMADYHISPKDVEHIGVNTRWIYRDHLNFPHIVSQGNPPDGVLTCYRACTDSSGAIRYVFGIHLPSSELSGFFPETQNNRALISYLVDKNGMIVAGPGAHLGDTVSRDILDACLSHTDDQSIFLEDRKILFTPVYGGEWYLITELSESYIRKSTNILVNIILVALVLTTLLTIICILYISGSLTKKINCLTAAMELVRENTIRNKLDNLNALLPDAADNGDEIDRISISCRHMLKALDKSFHEVLELSIREERLNYQLLQSQINPHFLYNILASIQTLLSLNELNKANQMLTDLSLFYRHLLHKSNERVTIRDELEIAELYLKMEALCKNYIFDWSIHMDEGIEHFLICKFTLQPILENCVRHGLRSDNSHLHIEIGLTYENDMILIVISDNGIGIPPDRLSSLQEDLSRKTVRYDRHFGISNINARIASPLQEFGTVAIESALSEGTTVRILIPQILE